MMCTNGGSKARVTRSVPDCTVLEQVPLFTRLQAEKEMLTDSCVKNLKVSPRGYPEFSVGDSRGSVFCVCVVVLTCQASLSLSRPLTCSRFPYPFSIFLVLHHPGLSLKTEKLQQKIIRSLGCSEITLFFTSTSILAKADMAYTTKIISYLGISLCHAALRHSVVSDSL